MKQLKIHIEKDKLGDKLKGLGVVWHGGKEVAWQGRFAANLKYIVTEKVIFSIRV